MKRPHAVDAALVAQARAALLEYLPKDEIIAAYLAAAGGEIASGNFASPRSSAVLAADAFGFFVGGPERAGRLIWPDRLSHLGRASSVCMEAKMAFPWSGGEHPWLDVGIDAGPHLIGVEAKRFEPFDGAGAVDFSPAYNRPVWGSAMRPFEDMRDRLRADGGGFTQLGATQLVKHAFGLRTQAANRGQRAVLVYLYAEPELRPDGRAISPEAVATHRSEVASFTRAVQDAEVRFESLTYHELLSAWGSGEDSGRAEHARLVAQRFGL